MMWILSRTVEWTNRLAALASGLLLVVLLVSVALQVFYRYVLLAPLVWSEEIARYCMVWITFLAGGLAISQHLNPRLELFEQYLSSGGRRRIALVVNSLTMTFLVVLTLVGLDVALVYSEFPSQGSGVPQSWPRLALPVGGFLMLLNLLHQSLKGPSNESGVQGGY